MSANDLSLLRKFLTLIGFLAILSLLAAGQLAAVFLLILPMAFLIFGRRQDQNQRDVSREPDRSHPR